MIKDMILTAGPSITYKEIDYVIDSVKFGWNRNHSDYIKKFEAAVADYIGVSYACATSSCTGALHLGLLAMGVGPGDEVIVPDISWIATASAVTYTGAKPIFCDIDSQTWVMDLNKIESLITERTKVVIPVHLYGNPVDMDRLLDLKKKYGFLILEDAAPSFGTIHNGKKTGSFGDAAAFSFQGAKALVAGEGGIFLTNNKEIFKKFKVLWDHGRDADNPRIDQINLIGYKYKMSNLQAAIGLAQVERVEEIVKKKREIFDLYKERLGSVKGIQINSEMPNSRQLFWMTSIVLEDSINVTREEFMNRLKNYNIDSRPFFPSMSNYGIFEHNPSNKISDYIGFRGINLPSGHNLTFEEIDYISDVVIYLVQSYSKESHNKDNTHQSHINISGWLETKTIIINKLSEYKFEKGKELSFQHAGKTSKLIPINSASISIEELELLSKWREAAQTWFPSQSIVTLDGTKEWLYNSVDKIDDRILFWIINNEGIQVGHVGLFRFDFKKSQCELDNIIRGNSIDKGIVESALNRLIQFTEDELDVKNVFLRVFSDNTRAINLYEKLGFVEVQRRPLKKTIQNGNIKYIELNDDIYENVTRYFSTMKMNRKNNGA